MTEPQQTDIVSEARTLAEYVDGLAAGLQDVKLGRASTLLRQLADEVERLRGLTQQGEKSDVFSDEYAALGHDEKDSYT